MKNNMIPARVLPDIIMYGGDTEPWRIEYKKQTGSVYAQDILDECVCVLHMAPFSQSAYICEEKLLVPALSKTASLSLSETGRLVADFSFSIPDTLNLRGKFVYQISLSYADTEMWVGQGHLVIKPNANRGAL